MRAAAWVIGIERVSDRSERVSDQNERVRGRSERVRDQSERVSLREMFRDESECERESYYFNQPVIKIIFFFFCFHEQYTSIFRCVL